MILGMTNTVSYFYWIISCSIIKLLSFIETKRPELRDLCKYVLPLYAAHWQKIGVFLDIKLEQFKLIKFDNLADAKLCCHDMFIKWLQGTDNVTWEKMFGAIDLATVSFSIDSVPTTTTTVAISKLYEPCSAIDY